MSITRFFLALSLAFSVFLFAGCDNGDLGDMPPLPPADIDQTYPAGGLIMDPDGTTGWNPGSDNQSLGERPAGDNWAAVSPDNLGFPVIFFAYDSDTLVPSETAKLNKVAQYLSEQASLGLIIEGHCDQRGTEEYNRALGERRANAVRAYLSGIGLDDSRIRTMSYGKDRPAIDGSGESIWRQNRRGVLVPAYMR